MNDLWSDCITASDATSASRPQRPAHQTERETGDRPERTSVAMHTHTHTHTHIHTLSFQSYCQILCVHLTLLNQYVTFTQYVVQSSFRVGFIPSSYIARDSQDVSGGQGETGSQALWCSAAASQTAGAAREETG